MALTRVALLGHPLIERDGRAVQVDTRKAVALLAYLAVKARPQSRDALAALLWSEYDETSARAALRRTLSTLRGAIGEECVAADRRTVQLHRDLLDIDTDRFSAALARGRSHDHDLRTACERCLPALIEAIDIARGDFLEGFSLRDAPEFEDWQLIEAQAIRRDLAQALEGASAGFAAVGRHDTAIEYARRWLALDSLHEPAHRTLMRLYAKTGQRPAALQQYRECVRVLEEELAVAPVEETTQLYQSIREGNGDAPMSVVIAPVHDRPAPRRLPLVGRSLEWARLAEACDAMLREGFLVALEGEAGIGKTRLMEEMLARAGALGASAIAARCYEGETGLAYAPIVQLLRGVIDAAEKAGSTLELTPRDSAEVARLIPELADHHQRRENTRTNDQQPLNNPITQARFLDAITRMLLAPANGRAVILAVDDLQWADAASVECLLYLLRRLGNRKVGLVLTWRSEGFPTAPQAYPVVGRAVSAAERKGSAALIRLGRLDMTAVQELVEAVAPPDPNRSGADLSAWLYRETEGLPLFLDEYLAAVASGVTLDAPPRGVQELLESRLAAVSEIGRQLLTSAAVIGRSFDFETLRQASGRDEEAGVSGLEELTSLGLVAAVSGSSLDVPTYDFGHDKLRVLVYERTSLPRRRLLHRRVAEALIAQSKRPGDDAAAGTIAHHYQLAGSTAEAAGYYWRAGVHARTLYANREALTHFEAALALGYEDAAGLQEALGDLHVLLGEYRSAVARFESAAALAEGIDLARIEHKLAGVCDRWGEWDLAETHFEAALSALDAHGGGPAAKRARIYADRAMAAHHKGEDGRATELATTALGLAQDAEDAEALGRVHNMLGVLAAGAGGLGEASSHLRQSLEYARKLSEPAVRVAALHNLALVTWRQGDADDATALVENALEISTAHGDRHREAALHNTLADLSHARGDPDAAMEHLKRAVTIYAEIGADEPEMRPEIWKLTEW